MSQETRFKMAKHYLSLSEKDKKFQKELAKYVPEYEESLIPKTKIKEKK